MVDGGMAFTRTEVGQMEVKEVKVARAAKYNVNPSLSPREMTSIHRVLEVWGEVFADNPKTPREVKTTEHVITLLDECPVRHRPLRVSPEIEAEVARQINEMLQNNIIRPSTSPWASQVILV